jgi:chromosome segregation protein
VFLKSLTLKGFKSFAESTTLEFEPGFTLIVGPNGSGKSNLVDAVAWVLGAQGPRMLRSAKMDDVIFAGSPARPALGRAEVSLTIDNSAGLLPIDFSEVTITRTLFRSGESEYAVNGVPCRLLDVQELLSDTGVGRQQHVIVSQGNLDSVLLVRPEERRAVIEEAAGVLKYRRRKEKAERRLESTEGTLVRLQDLLREVRRQLRPLERQAAAAQRHGDLVAELNALRRHLVGRELVALEAGLGAAERDCGGLGRTEEELKAALARLDAEVVRGEDELARLRSASADARISELLSKAEALRSRAASLAAVVEERGRWLGRSLNELEDRDLIASLEAEAQRLRFVIAEVDAEAESLLPRAAELEQAEAALGDALAPKVAPNLEGRAAAVAARQELNALRAALQRAKAEEEQLESRAKTLSDRAARMEAEGARLAEMIDDYRHQLERISSEEVEARLAETAAEAAAASAAAVLRAADGERHRLESRVEMLGQALGSQGFGRGPGGRERNGDDRPEGFGGLRLLAELIEVDPGYEAAVEAAAGDILGAVVVDGLASVRQAVDQVRETLAIGEVVGVGPGALTSQSERTPKVVMAGGMDPLRPHVRPRPVGTTGLLGHLLDILFGEVAVAPSWNTAIDAAIAHPGSVVVTVEGDRFCAGGVIRWARRGPSATLAALEQARADAAAAADRVAEAEQRVTQMEEAVVEARRRRIEASRALDATTSSLQAAAQALERHRAELAEQRADAETFDSQLAERRLAQQRDAERAAELEAQLPGLESVAREEAARVEQEQDARYRAAEMRRHIEVRAAALSERRELAKRRLAEIEQQLGRQEAHRSKADSRRHSLLRARAGVQGLQRFLGDRLSILDGLVARLGSEREGLASESRRRSDELEALRRERASLEHRLEEVRERLGRARLELAEHRLKLDSLGEQVRRDLDCEPEMLRDAPCPELPPGTSAHSRRSELERELRMMGPVNPLALEEHASLLERHRFLEAQLEDVRSARRELHKVIRAVDAEISGTFAAAYADVAENFERIFGILFPGGEGRLRLADPDNLLETGIEVEVRPAGRNVKRLSLLSGGERSLVALAFLFAVFRSRPSPFYLLDEVEAALDDANLHRFLDLLHEFRDEAQLLIVSHQKRTMEIADCLYGVTMGPAGSSRVISQRMSEQAAS